MRNNAYDLFEYLATSVTYLQTPQIVVPPLHFTIFFPLQRKHDTHFDGGATVVYVVVQSLVKDGSLPLWY
jgi:hypothetical protein